MSQESLLELIRKAGKRFSVIGEQSEEKIREYETKLNVIFPADYRWYLKKYGAGGVGNVDVYGIDPEGFIDIIDKKELFRKIIISDKILPFLSYGEFIYCIDTEKSSKDISSIVIFYMDEEPEYLDKNFYEVISSEFERVIEE